MQPVILLHGALGSATDFEPLKLILSADNIPVHTLLFSGHGKSAFNSNFGIGQFTLELEDFIIRNRLVKPNVFGYSMGGYVALNLARKESTLQGNIITLGTKFNWNVETVEKEIKMLQPDLMIQKVPAYVKTLEEKHGPSWRDLVTQTSEMMQSLAKNNLLAPQILTHIPNKVLVGLSDNDQMVTLDETLMVCKSLPNAGMFMLPCSRHPLESSDLEIMAAIVKRFTK
jgi:esterase/lipase